MKARTSTNTSVNITLKRFGTGVCAAVLAGSLVGTGIAAPLAQATGADASVPAAGSEESASAPAEETLQANQADQAAADAGTTTEPDAPADASAAQAAPQTDVASAAQQAVPNQTPAPVVDEAAAARAEADLPSLMGKLEAASKDYDRAYAEYQAATEALASTEQKISADQEAIARAKKALDAAQSELGSAGTITIWDILRGTTSVEKAETHDYLLNVVIEDRASFIQAKQQELDEKSQSHQGLSDDVEAKKTAFNDALSQANKAAFAVEKSACALPRTGNKLRTSAQSATNSWYDKVNKLSGVESKLVFGTGADFSLDKDAFVAKWGTAIDSFFAQYEGRAGASSPLKGCGAEIAAQAYDQKVDPRLCAAVSVVESSAGVYCIKPHNAWGWGAADSNPYAGAASWGSWASAIKSWHKGLTGSKTGMATAGSVSRLGGIYCSSWDWPSKVVDEMQRISDLTE